MFNSNKCDNESDRLVFPEGVSNYEIFDFIPMSPDSLYRAAGNKNDYSSFFTGH